LVRGVGTDFEKQAQKGGLLVLPTINNAAANAEIADILGPEQLRIKREFKGEDAIKQLTGRDSAEVGEKIEVRDGFDGSSYMTAPKIDQTKVYDAVFDRLDHNGCVCIFPEGGSHDRTELLPLKRTLSPVLLGPALMDIKPVSPSWPWVLWQQIPTLA
jgi:glycerol-3-phosphate O-acyltransferase/dihydroxyacetone phosphate acyltransferase